MMICLAILNLCMLMCNEWVRDHLDAEAQINVYLIINFFSLFSLSSIVVLHHVEVKESIQ